MVAMNHADDSGMVYAGVLAGVLCALVAAGFAVQLAARRRPEPARILIR
ncbi:MAG: hypothetical protein ACYDAY_08790 [Candidatus Dormibacteria bacterium]